MSSAERNKELIRRMYAELSGKVKPDDRVAEFMSDAELRRHVAETEAAFPGYEIEAEVMVAEGDRVAVRGMFRGKHEGPFGPLRPTGKRIEVLLHIIYRIEDGKVAETWMEMDRITMLEQLGVLTDRPRIAERPRAE